MHIRERSGKDLKLQLRNENLLVISPNFRLFLRNQVISIRPFFSQVTVFVPQPYFPKILLNVPFFRSKFLFLESCDTSGVYGNAINVIFPKFFTLPIEVMRKRTPLIAAQNLISILKRSNVQFSLVHAHRLDFGFMGASLKDIYGKPLIITCHGSDVYDFPFRDDFRYAIAKYTLSRVDYAIAVCRSDAEKLLSLGLPSNKLSIIPNGFDESLFQPMAQQLAREKLKLPPNKKIVLSVGTLHEVKGHSYLIDAMCLLSKVRKDIVAVIVGSGPLEMKLREKIDKLGLKQRVLLVGWEPHNRIPLWMNASDIFVLPSLNEGFPAVIPEAMACGKPIIGTKVGGIPDVILDNNVGILASPGDPELLSESILEALDRRWEPETIQGYAQKYSSENIVKQILRVHQHVIGDLT